MKWSMIMAPLLGGLIGYITNGIAIKMLFRPLKPVYLFGKKLPFTPGLIPKERGRIARSVGQVVSKELINEETLSATLLKPEFIAAIEKKVDSLIDENSHNEETVEYFASRVLGKERVVYLQCEAEEALVQVIYRSICQMDVGSIMVAQLVQAIEEGKINLGPLALFVNGSMIQSLGEKLAPVVNQMLEEQGEVFIRSAVEKESEAFLEKTLGDGISKLQDHRKIIKSIVIQLYEYAIRKKLAPTLALINIEKMVEDKINTYDPLEMERLILDIMDKELKAIIWLGALLGAIMGCFMYFLP